MPTHEIAEDFEQHVIRYRGKDHVVQFEDENFDGVMKIAGQEPSAKQTRAFVKALVPDFPDDAPFTAYLAVSNELRKVVEEMGKVYDLPFGTAARDTVASESSASPESSAEPPVSNG